MYEPNWLEIFSTVVMAAATVALAAVGIIEIRARRQDTGQRNGRLDAAARYYAMLVQRSTHEAFKKLQRLLDEIGRASCRERV